MLTLSAVTPSQWWACSSQQEELTETGAESIGANSRNKSLCPASCCLVLLCPSWNQGLQNRILNSRHLGGSPNRYYACIGLWEGLKPECLKKFWDLKFLLFSQLNCPSHEKAGLPSSAALTFEKKSNYHKGNEKTSSSILFSYFAVEQKHSELHLWICLGQAVLSLTQWMMACTHLGACV